MERYIDDRVNQAFARLKTDVQPWWGSYSRPLRVLFPNMNASREIVHGLSAIPDGFAIVYADADIVAEPGVPWTRDLAFLRGGAMNARAVVIFYTLREDITDA